MIHMGPLEIQQYIIGIAIFSVTFSTLQYNTTDHEFQHIAL